MIKNRESPAQIGWVGNPRPRGEGVHAPPGEKKLNISQEKWNKNYKYRIKFSIYFSLFSNLGYIHKMLALNKIYLHCKIKKNYYFFLRKSLSFFKVYCFYETCVMNCVLTSLRPNMTGSLSGETGIG